MIDLVGTIGSVLAGENERSGLTGHIGYATLQVAGATPGLSSPVACTG
jgi:hypothetical protein